MYYWSEGEALQNGYFLTMQTRACWIFNTSISSFENSVCVPLHTCRCGQWMHHQCYFFSCSGLIYGLETPTQDNNTYFFRVRAQDDRGNAGEWSNIVSASNIDREPLEKPVSSADQPQMISHAGGGRNKTMGGTNTKTRSWFWLAYMLLAQIFSVRSSHMANIK